jgi:O-antigen ligase
MKTSLRANLFDRRTFLQLADWLAVGVALSLPWSTSATAILITLWLLAYVPALDAGALRRELGTAAGGLPVLLWVLAALGMLWAAVSWAERFDGLGGFHRLLVIPLLLAQFRVSDRGMLVLGGFLVSATCLLATSWAFAVIGVTIAGKSHGVPVKDYIFQSGIFLVCAFALIAAAGDFWRALKRAITLALAVLAALFLADIAFIAASRTVLLVAPLLAVALGYRQFGLKGALAAAVIAAALAGALWLESTCARASPIRCRSCAGISTPIPRARPGSTSSS